MATLIGGSPMPAISPDLPCTANGTRSRLKTGITITAPRAGQNSLNSRVQTFYMRDMRQGPTTRKGLRIGGSARPASPTSKQPSAGPQPRTISELFSSLLGLVTVIPDRAICASACAIWGCPVLVDGLWAWELRVGFCCLHGGFVGHGRAVTQGRVQPDRVVPALDVAEAGHLRLGLGGKPAAA